VRCVESILLITQTKEDVPFDLQSYRYIEYDLEPSGLDRLQRVIADVIRTQFLPYRFVFRITKGETEESGRFMGNDRSLYSFAIRDVMTAADAVQFRLDVVRHEPGRSKRVYTKLQRALQLGETLPIPRTPYALKVDKISDEEARFCVCNPDQATH
jgi:hypothetical protein